jgi:maltose O-acetyltransferase
MTEKEKMLASEVYSAVDPELLEELMVTREMLYEYNSLHPSEIVSKLAAFSSCCSC